MRHLLICGSCLLGMLGVAASAHAQAVQLPTFRSFGVQTSVSVPDRGGMVLGGVNSASSGSTTRGFGPLRSRASGSSVGAATTSVHATIIDHREWDEAVLAEARRRRGEEVTSFDNVAAPAADPHTAAKAARLSRQIAQRADRPAAMPASAAGPSLAEVRATAAARQQAKQREAAEKLAAGIASEEAGKLSSARGYYESAIRLGDDAIRAEAAARLAPIALPSKRSPRVVGTP